MTCISRIRVYQYRNIEETDVHLCSRIAVFHGDNAQGKTNLLEAVHLASNLQSFRTRRVADLIRRGEKESSVRIEVKEKGWTTVLGVNIEGDGKKATIDGRTPKSAVEYLEVLKSVFFGPQDIELASGNLAMRRRFIDRAVFSEDPGHLDRMKNHARALRQRNEAIRSSVSSLEPWNEQLAQLWHDITKARLSALEGLKSKIADIHLEVSGGKETIEFRLKSAEKTLSGGAAGLLALLAEDEEEDRKRGYTKHGPHRDRIEVALDGREIASHGSQGQRRTAAVSMKLAMLSWIEEKSGAVPVFILDDPGSELDRKRLGFLGEFISEFKGQTLISSVGADDVPTMPGTDKETFTVSAGKIEKTRASV